MGKQEIFDFLKRNNKRAYTQRQIQRYMKSTVKWNQLNSLAKTRDVKVSHKKIKKGNRKSKVSVKHYRFIR